MENQVAFLNLKQVHSTIAADLQEAARCVIESGHYIKGGYLAKFEAEFAQYVGANHCVGVGNGLDALRLSLKALGVGPGDEVIVPSNTFIATWLAVQQVGAKIVPVEPIPGSFLIDVEAIRKKITKKSKVIIPVHLYGAPVDIEAICELAKANDLFVLEDAAQAHGAEFNGKKIGSHGDLVCWSFYPGKNLGCLGDGGAVTSNNSSLIEAVRRIGNVGSVQKYHHEVVGENSRLDELQAAFLSVKLKYLDLWNSQRAAIASRYLAEIKNPRIKLPRVEIGTKPVWHLFVVKVNEREEFQRYLEGNGIQSLIHYPIPPHKSGAFGDQDFGDSFSKTEAEADQILSLPMGPHLSESQVDRVISVVNGW